MKGVKRADRLGLISSKIKLIKEKKMRKRKSEEEERRRAEKTMVILLVFVIATLVEKNTDGHKRSIWR